MVFELRPAHDPTKAYGFVGVVSLKDLSASIWLWHRDGGKWAIKKVIEIPAEPADPELLPPVLKASRRCRRWSPTSTFDGRPVPLRLLLGHRRSASVRCLRSVQSEAHRHGAHRRHRLARRASRRQDRSTAARRWSRSAATASASISPTRSTARSTAILSRRHRRLDGEARRRRRRRHRLRSEILPDLAEEPPAAPGAAGRRRLLVGLLLLSVTAPASYRRTTVSRAFSTSAWLLDAGFRRVTIPGGKHNLRPFPMAAPDRARRISRSQSGHGMAVRRARSGCTGKAARWSSSPSSPSRIGHALAIALVAFTVTCSGWWSTRRRSAACRLGVDRLGQLQPLLPHRHRVRVG